MAEQSVYQAPSADLSVAAASDYPGLRRLPYFLYGIAAQIAYIMMVGMFADTPVVAGAAMLVWLGVFVYLAFQRFKNIGTSGWWVCMFIVPLANIYFALKATAFPEGYEDHKTMDTAGKVLIGLFVGAIVLGVGAAIMLPAMIGMGVQ